MKTHYDIFDGIPTCKTKTTRARTTEDVADVDCRNCNRILIAARTRAMIKRHK